LLMESIVQTGNDKKQIGRYLKDNREKFLHFWEEEIIVHYQKDNKGLILMNGSLMYDIITTSIEDGYSDHDIQSFAYKVGEERANANVNIGEFVYNVNLGRSILIKYINLSGIKTEEWQPIIDLINKQFDLFCYYAVTRYTEIMDERLQEKNLFISQTHKDRLSILGQMSSSFVHEFRNPLTSVMGFIKLLQHDHPQLPYLDIISTELDQLKFRITQFLHTSKMNLLAESNSEEITIHLLIKEVVDFLYPSIVGGNIQMVSTIDEDIKVNGDRNELKQIFLNLLMNAIDAVCEEENLRKITIESNIEDQQVKICISNNGPTIHPEAVQFIFEPFFTTKKLGTGIGLFVCKNIVEKNNGEISCMSDDHLTTFQVTFPIKKN
jgi:signal transduction histidine kinase